MSTVSTVSGTVKTVKTVKGSLSYALSLSLFDSLSLTHSLYRSLALAPPSLLRPLASTVLNVNALHLHLLRFQWKEYRNAVD